MFVLNVKRQKMIETEIAIENEILKYSDTELKQILCPSTTLDAWTFEGKYIREAIQGNRVLNPSIDLSNKCNLNCPYCYIEKVGSLNKKKNKDELSFEEYKNIIDKLAYAGAQTINIIGAGEPTIDNNFKRISKHIRSLNMNVLVATNGIEIAKSDSFTMFLNDINASVVLKVNSFDTKLQDILVGRKDYSKMRNIALKKLIDSGFNKSNPTRLAINTLLMKSNLDEVFDIFKFCRDNNITYIAGNYMPTGRTEGSVFQGEYLLKEKESKELFEPISTEEYTNIRKMIVEYDNANNFPIISPDAYISGLPCIQGLGVQIDNKGKIWHCPARQQLLNGELVSKGVDFFNNTTDFEKLWKEDSYLKWFRNNYNGTCPYKTM